MSGAMRVPVWPTWSVWLRQPLLVTAREQPTTPPSSPASSSSGAKPSAEPTPRPPPTTTGAVASVTPAARSTRSRDDGAGQRPDRASTAANAAVAGRRRLAVGLEGVVGDGEQLDRRVERASLEQRAAPAHADQLARRRRHVDLGAVGDERQVEAGGRLGHHLVAAIGAASPARPPGASARTAWATTSPHASGP